MDAKIKDDGEMDMMLLKKEKISLDFLSYLHNRSNCFGFRLQLSYSTLTKMTETLYLLMENLCTVL